MAKSHQNKLLREVAERTGICEILESLTGKLLVFDKGQVAFRSRAFSAENNNNIRKENESIDEAIAMLQNGYKITAKRTSSEGVPRDEYRPGSKRIFPDSLRIFLTQDLLDTLKPLIVQRRYNQLLSDMVIETEERRTKALAKAQQEIEDMFKGGRVIS